MTPTDTLPTRRTIRIAPVDNVAVALQRLEKGSSIDVDGMELTAAADIEPGHKIAPADIPGGSDVIKYGFPIGHALHDISAGSLVDHNDIATNLAGRLDYSGIEPRGAAAEPPTCPEGGRHTFMGYRRRDGRAGIRNEVWVIPTVGCVNGIVREIAARVNAATGNGAGTDGIYAFTHNYGCSQLGGDHENTRKILRDMVGHPNAGAVLVVGLGCENNQPDAFRAFCGDVDPERVGFMVSQQVEGDEIEHGVELLTRLYERARHDRREAIDVSELTVGLKCGGSDGFSGLTANPLLGRFSDWLCACRGGATVLTEVPEMFGAEALLMERCADRATLDKTISLINDFKQYFLDHGQPVGENPSPGNKAGGISTLEEKALGCTQKSGTTAVRDVIGYGERVGRRGLTLLSAPGNDLVAASALAAAGCQMVLFTTGRGTPFATFVPTVKVSTNSDLARRKPAWIDFDAGPLAADADMDTLLPRFIDYVLDVASGRLTAAERAGIHDLAIFKNGVTL